MMRMAFVWIIALVAGCSAPVARVGDPQGGETALIVARGKYFADVGESLGLHLKTVNGEAVSFLSSGSPFTEIVPGTNVKLSGSFETAKKGAPIGGVLTWKTLDFETVGNFDPGWVYLIEPVVHDNSVEPQIKPICKSTNHKETVQSLLRQGIFMGSSDSFHCR